MDNETMTKNQALIKHVYRAFNERNIDAILEVMHPRIKWTKAWEKQYANGPAEVRAYWEKQWTEIDPKVTPVAFEARGDGSLEVSVEQLVKDLNGVTIFDGKVKHIYIINDGLLEQMDVEQS